MFNVTKGFHYCSLEQLIWRSLCLILAQLKPIVWLASGQCEPGLANVCDLKLYLSIQFSDKSMLKTTISCLFFSVLQLVTLQFILPERNTDFTKTTVELFVLFCFFPANRIKLVFTVVSSQVRKCVGVCECEAEWF